MDSIRADVAVPVRRLVVTRSEPPAAFALADARLASSLAMEGVNVCRLVDPPTMRAKYGVGRSANFGIHTLLASARASGVNSCGEPIIVMTFLSFFTGS